MHVETITIPLNQAVWEAWLAKNRRKEVRFNARFARVMVAIAITGLLASVVWIVIARYRAGVSPRPPSVTTSSGVLAVNRPRTAGNRSGRNSRYAAGFVLRGRPVCLRLCGISTRTDWILGPVSPDPLHILQRWPSPSVLWPRHRGQAINILPL